MEREEQNQQLSHKEPWINIQINLTSYFIYKQTLHSKNTL